MRSLGSMAVLLFVGVAALPTGASSVDGRVFDQQSIDALEVRANQAQPREQCFLYAELVHEMTEFTLRQYATGDVDKASAMLRHIQQFTKKIHLSLGEDNKRLKNAEILLRHTAFRLAEMLHTSSFEDRPLVEQTLAQVNQAETEAMLQVFRK